jgi:hypothetical protein
MFGDCFSTDFVTFFFPPKKINKNKNWASFVYFSVSSQLIWLIFRKKKKKKLIGQVLCILV